MSDKPSNRALWPYIAPFALFILLLPAADAIRKLGLTGSFWTAAPEQWVYPLQTILCAGVLWFYRREYPRDCTARGLLLGAAIGVLALGVWLSPQWLFHVAPRVGAGFNPETAPAGWYAAAVVMRFARLVVVVPLVEEIFWRGFLLRYLIREDFTAVPLGAYTALSFWAVAVGFTLEHSTPDMPAAFVTGALFNLVAIRTRSLPACVMAHAVTNLLLGLYVMRTRQWGFW